ncbi:SDR family oxidoreductase [Streptomyces tremellae]|uniref:SDR family oxidoreductase n=2 Tax=Streptomyces tremellae TaxID=1124239 RepID=A0ABP7GAP1_9ACTN
MKILVTGAAGYIGAVVSRTLAAHGHQVVGLAHSARSERAILAMGLPARRGNLDDRDSLEAACSDADVVVDTASADHAGSAEHFLRVLAGTGRTYVRTSGTGIYIDLAAGALNPVVHHEDDGWTPLPPLRRRFSIDQKVLEADGEGLRTVIIRPSMIYGQGASEQLPVLFRAALKHGFAGYSAPGLNRYANVYLDDLAEVYPLVVENPQARGVYNVAASECDSKTISEAIGAALGLPVRPFEDAEEGESVLGHVWNAAMGCNSRVDARRVREELGWRPRGPELVPEIVEGSYRRLWGPKSITVDTGQEAEAA